MKIVFIASSLQDPHVIKRIEEFVMEGYEVVVYGFSRKKAISLNIQNLSMECLGEYSNDVPYKKRIRLIYNGICRVRKKYAAEQVLWYFFGLDVALFASILVGCKKPYIYEECDLVHTYIKNHIVSHILEFVDRCVINRSLMSIFTSEGFLIYHYGNNKRPANTYVITNRLNTSILQIPLVKKRPINLHHLSFAFVGGARFDSLLSISEIILKNFPNHSFHFFGEPVDIFSERFLKLKSRYDNCYFHGAFKNPDDLPSIYSQIDIVVATYDIKYANVRYAEPNKIYESIYFETPIVVTEGTFLANKVSMLNIGYAVNPFNEHSVCEWVKNLSKASIEEKKASCNAINKTNCLNINTSFFSEFSMKISAL